MTAAAENRISNGFHVLLITHALFLIQIPKNFIGNCFQVGNVLAAQFERHSDCESTYPIISLGALSVHPLKFAMQMNICLYLT